MRLLLFCNNTTRIGRQLQEIVEAQVPREDLTICRTVGALSRRLHRPRGPLSMVVLLVASRKTLSELLSLGDLLNDIPLILVLPDNEADTLSKGHRFHPRFTCGMDGDFSEVALVLAKMIENGALKNGGF